MTLKIKVMANVSYLLNDPRLKITISINSLLQQKSNHDNFSVSLVSIHMTIWDSQTYETRVTYVMRNFKDNHLVTKKSVFYSTKI